MSLKSHIPNFITTLNLACGITGVVFSFGHHPHWAFYCMLAAAVFDFCDGFAARVLKAYSPMGKELDSLCDIVSFGVLPSVMMYNNMKVFAWGAENFWAFLPLLLSIGVALRLAKFNVDERQHESFLGLASPVAALLCASLCYYVEFEPNSLLGAFCANSFFLPSLSLLLCILMLCEMPMFSFKFSKGQPKSLTLKRLMFVLDIAVIALGVLLLRTNWALIVFLACLLYIIKNLFFLLPLRRK